MRLRDAAYLLDMLQACLRLQRYLQDIPLDQFLEDDLLQDAVRARLAVLGEAARRVSDDTRSALGDVDWRRIIGTRNFIVHEYDTVDPEVVWDTVNKDVPRLIRALEGVLPPESH